MCSHLEIYFVHKVYIPEHAKDEPATLISLNCISRCTCSSILCCAHMLLAMQESEMAAAKISVKNVTKLLRLVCLICFCMQLA